MSLDATAIRLLLAIAIAAGLVGAYKAVSALVLWRAARGKSTLTLFTPGMPGVLYFTTQSCVTCRAAQKPALRELASRMEGKIQVIEVDAEKDAELARKWSVLSVPTTFVLDAGGTPRQVNHGFASAEKLITQLSSI